MTWPICRKHHLWRAFVDCLIDNDEKLALLKTYPIQDQSAKTIHYLRPKWPKSISYLWPKWMKYHTLWRRTYLQSPYKGVHPVLPDADQKQRCAIWRKFRPTPGRTISCFIIIATKSSCRFTLSMSWWNKHFGNFCCENYSCTFYKQRQTCCSEALLWSLTVIYGDAKLEKVSHHNFTEVCSYYHRKPRLLYCLWN